MNVEICPLKAEWIQGTADLQRECFPPPFPAELLWQEEHLDRHIALFPEGQFVAIRDGAVVASSSSMRITSQDWLSPHTWDELTGGLFLSNHMPDGDLLYGVDISVHPDYRGRGIARLLYQARFDLVRSLGLKGFAAICRLPDFKGSGVSSLEEYVAEVALGKRQDRTMTPLLKLGLTVRGVAFDCMEDEESGNSGARLEWQP